MSARTAGCIPFRQRRGSHGFEWPARKAVAPTRFHCRQRSLGWLWFFSAINGWRSRACLRRRKGARWYDEITSGKGAQAAVDIITSFGKGQLPKGFPLPGTPAYRSAWQEVIKAADEANEPNEFTAFIGYEWTSNDKGNNLHRNVIFRDDGRKASLIEPYTTQLPLGSPNPRDLWKWMAMCEEKTGAQVLAIAHNGNLSNGRMFPIIESFTGKKIDRAIRRESHALGAALRNHTN